MSARPLAFTLAFGAVLAVPAAAGVDRSTPPAPAAVAPFTLPVPQTFTLKNGLKVHFLERRRAPLVDIVVNVGVGALDDAAGKEGTATALADLLGQGAGDRDAFAFDDAAQALGASIEASADWQRTTLSLSTLSRTVDDALPLLADALLRPRLQAEDWERKQQERLGELAYYMSEPRTLATLAAARALFPSGRQSTAVMGTPTSVTGITVADVRAMHTATFRPDNAFVVVVGDIDKARTQAALERALGGWAAPATTLRAAPVPQEPAALSQTSVVLLDRPSAPQSVLHVTQPILTDILPFDGAAAVVQTLLGGSFTSRLNANLREKNQFSYGASYSYDVRPAHRSRVSSSVKSAVTIPAINEIIKELRAIRAPVPAVELERARAYEALTFPSVLDGGDGLAGAWSAWLEDGTAPDVVAGYMKRVLGTTDAAFSAAAARLVDPDKVTIVVVGDRAALESELRAFGPVTIVTPAALLP